MKAVALLSGGLDSILAIRIILEQNIEVEAVNFITPFYNRQRDSNSSSVVEKIAVKFGLKLKVFNLEEDYLKVIESPKYGYGSNLNPCIDCRIFMQKKAKEYLDDVGGLFLITGEVLGQRPMSQHKNALRIIERESGLESLVLRPLSAKLLPPTIPEERGWVNRERLFALSGRSRKPQINLAKEYGIDDYPTPTGGCLLTDAGFSHRMKDLLRSTTRASLNDIELLKLGRHFRISGSAKFIVGRDEKENGQLTQLAQENDFLFHPIEVKGALGLGRGLFQNGDIETVSRIVARYSDGARDTRIAISSQILPEGEESMIMAFPLSDTELQKFRI